MDGGANEGLQVLRLILRYGGDHGTRRLCRMVSKCLLKKLIIVLPRDENLRILTGLQLAEDGLLFVVLTATTTDWRRLQVDLSSYERALWGSGVVPRWLVDGEICESTRCITRRLSFRHSFSQSMGRQWLPSHLTHLSLGHHFDAPVDGALPATLTHLTFGKRFNQPVGCLPLGLTHLAFGKRFNQPVERLPPTLVRLSFGQSFDQDVDSLPQGLSHLILGDAFNRSIDSLPSLLISLSWKIGVERSDANGAVSWCRAHRHLNGGRKKTKRRGFHLGCFDQPVVSWPMNLTHLTLGTKFNSSLDSLPVTLTHLIFRRFGVFNRSIKHLPPRLSHLVLSWAFNQPLDFHLPLLTHLHLGNRFDWPLDGLPTTLVTLSIDRSYSRTYSRFQKKLEHLPPSLRRLKLGPGFRQPLDRLPATLRYLSFWHDSQFEGLPEGLTHLNLMGGRVHLKTLPPSLVSLQLRGRELSLDHQFIESPPPNLTFITC